MFARAAVYTSAAVPFGRSYTRALHFKEDDVLLSSTAGPGSPVDGSDSGSQADEASDAQITKALFEENYYDILGLGEFGCNANDEQIKKACTCLCLLIPAAFLLLATPTKSCFCSRSKGIPSQVSCSLCVIRFSLTQTASFC